MSCSRAARASSHLLAVSMVMRPPSGMASRALMQRFRSAFSSWLGSTSVGQSPAAPTTLDRDRRAHGAPDQLLHAGDQRGSRRWAWDPASGGARRPAGGGSGPRPAGPRPGPPPCSARRRRAGPARMRVAISSRLPEMPASRLLKSCARPPVSWPTASIFWLWRSASSAWARAAACSFSARDVAAAGIDQRRPRARPPRRSSDSLRPCDGSGSRHVAASSSPRACSRRRDGELVVLGQARSRTPSAPTISSGRQPRTRSRRG